jgi:hypothetical protein
METYRQLVNGWINEFPEADRAEMVARMKDSDSAYYQAALAEVMMHAALLKLGYKVEIHPDSPHPTRKPDSLIKTEEGAPVAYLEVTTFGPTNEAVGMNNREATIEGTRLADILGLPDPWPPEDKSESCGQTYWSSSFNWPTTRSRSSMIIVSGLPIDR